jgi:hypothetical protein
MSVLGYTGVAGDLVMEPGPVEVSVGSSSGDIRSSATFTSQEQHASSKAKIGRFSLSRRSAS